MDNEVYSDFLERNAKLAQLERDGRHKAIAMRRRKQARRRESLKREYDDIRWLADVTAEAMPQETRKRVGRDVLLAEAGEVVRAHRRQVRSVTRGRRLAPRSRVPVVRTAGRERGASTRSVTSPRRRRTATAASKADPLPGPGEPDPACRAASQRDCAHSRSRRANEVRPASARVFLCPEVVA